MSKPKLLIINGALNGNLGNTFSFFKNIEHHLDELCSLNILELKSMNHLSSLDYQKAIDSHISSCDAIYLLSGTYWDSWSSYLQRFLEESTFLEASPKVFSKPAGVLTTMHSVSGKEVMSRLQGVLSSQGYLIPPHSALTISLASELARKAESSFQDDFWSSDEILHTIKNVLAYTQLEAKSSAWSVDTKDPKRLWTSLV
ncbi:MAG: hypothetical protein L6Q33_01495 [Bacteriovoracaceae bacterium]|nr:hypothetical protein [Bacteriovoracaceae bacterium]